MEVMNAITACYASAGQLNNSGQRGGGPTFPKRIACAHQGLAPFRCWALAVECATR
jgi:hypothetical protein